MFQVVRGVAVLAVVAGVCAGCGGDDGGSASVRFASPVAGSRVAGGVDVALTATGVEIEPAGEARDGAGHFHVIADAGCVAAGQPIAKDTDHVHLGSGASTGTIYLAPGSHTLCLQVGDGVHTALDLTDTVAVEVGVTDRDEFCDVIGEVDVLLDDVWTVDDFTGAQAHAASAARLVEQLQAATQYVDEAARPAVGDLLDFASAALEATIAAKSQEDLDAASAELSGRPEDAAQIEDIAFPWVLDTCGLELD